MMSSIERICYLSTKINIAVDDCLHDPSSTQLALKPHNAPTSRFSMPGDTEWRLAQCATLTTVCANSKASEDKGGICPLKYRLYWCRQGYT
jgi:hypothetical protein